MKKNLLFVCAVILFAVCASVTTVFAQQKFDVREKGKVVASVTFERADQVRTLSITRQGQPAHVYRSYPFVSAFSLSVGKEQILTYYSKVRQIDIKDSTFSLADVNEKTPNYGRDDVKALYQQVSDDMRVLRAVREVMPAVRLFETGLVVLTGNSSFLEGVAPETLTVDRDVAFIKTSAKAQTNPLEACNSRCQNTERRCVAAANGNQASIDRCFENSFRCQENCERVYGPIQP